MQDLKNIELNALPVYDNSYIKTKIITYDNNVYTNFRGLNVAEDDINANLLQPFLLIFCLYMKTNITCKYRISSKISRGLFFFIK